MEEVEHLFNGDTKVTMGVTLLKVFTDEPLVLESNDPNPEAQPFSVDMGSIIELNITEGMEQMGMTGSITIDNKFNLLEKMDFVNNSSFEVFIHLKIHDAEIGKAGSKYLNGFDVLCYVNNLQTASKNYNDNIVTFTFEEAAIAALKQLNLNKIYSKSEGFENVNLPLKGFDLKEFVRGITKNKHFSRINYSGNTEALGVDVRVGDEKVYTPNTKFHQNTMPDIPSMKTTNRRGEKFPSAYELLMRMLSDTLVAGVDRVPYFRMQSYPIVDPLGVVSTQMGRRLKFGPYVSERHLEMLKLVQKGNFIPGKQHDFSDVYTEKFAIGPFSGLRDGDPNIKPNNQVEQYTTSKCDPQRMKDTVWGDYLCVGVGSSPDPGIFAVEKIPFGTLQNIYIINEMGDMDVGYNMPVFKPEQLNDIKIEQENKSNAYSSTNARNQVYNHAYNRVAKSFLNITETMSFNCNGLLLREPGKFIWVEQSSLNVKLPHGDSMDNGDLDKIYFVNNVTHTFKNDMTYKTNIQASKWFGSTGRDKIKFGEAQNQTLLNKLPFDWTSSVEEQNQSISDITFKRDYVTEAVPPDIIRSKPLPKLEGEEEFNIEEALLRGDAIIEADPETVAATREYLQNLQRLQGD